MKNLYFFSLIFLVLCVSHADAQPYPHREGMGRGHGAPAFIDPLGANLNLTPEQLDRINAIRKSQTETLQPLQEKLNAKRRELRQLWLEPSPDREQIEAMNRDAREIRKKIAEHATGHRTAIFDILTPEQQDRLRAYEEKRGYDPGRFRKDKRGPHRPPGWEGHHRGN